VKASVSSINFILRKNTKDSLGHFFTYDTIPLKLYFEIIDGGQFTLVNTRGRGTVEQCLDAWEGIIKRNAEATGSGTYMIWFKTMRSYWALYAKHAIVNASLLLLKIKVDRRTIADLKKYGYHIDTSNSNTYADSLIRVSNQAKNLTTQLRMKENELRKMNEQKAVDEAKDGNSFDSVMAWLCLGTGLNLSDTITLGRYNEYVKAVKERNKPVTENGG
jgi:hypothetical protein